MQKQSAALFEELEQRGFIYQTTPKEGLLEDLSQGPFCFYAGFDPTAGSLHVGHLLLLVMMRKSKSKGS